MALRKRIGVMVPSTNTTCEADFQLVAPRDVTIHGQRLWLSNDAAGAAGMDRMNAEVESGARYLATAKVDVIAYGCTTGSFYRGPGWDHEMLDLIRRTAGVPGVATSPSVVEALRFFGARTISVATPYPDWNNKQLRAYLEALGFNVLNVEGEPRAGASGNQGISLVRVLLNIGSTRPPWTRPSTDRHGRDLGAYRGIRRGTETIRSWGTRMKEGAIVEGVPGEPRERAGRRHAVPSGTAAGAPL
jgi:hypothetical protein